MATPFEQLGGESVVRGIVERFVARQFEDRIIGFMFVGKDAATIARHEYEHAAASLGANVTYAGRPIVPLHRPLRINAGHFRRRLALLRQEIERSGVSAELTEQWLEGQRRMERAITDGSDCGPTDLPGPPDDRRPIKPGGVT